MISRLLLPFLLLPLPLAAQSTSDEMYATEPPQVFMLPLLTEAERQRWHAVGAVNGAGMTTKVACTGTLVAPTLVLTAAHCVPNPAGGDHAGQGRTFVAGLDVGSNVTYRNSDNMERHPAYEVAQGNSRYRYDIALVTLDEPIPPDLVPPLRIAPEKGDWEQGPFAIVGYSVRRPYALSGRFDCQPQPSPEGFIDTDCPVTGGNSGAPLLALVDGEWQVTGVVVATLGKLGPGRSRAVRLPPWARELIEAAQAAN